MYLQKIAWAFTERKKFAIGGWCALIAYNKVIIVQNSWKDSITLKWCE